MKNPEHESGYFEDGSDVEIISEECTIIEDRKWGSGSYGLAKAIRQLDVRDSPASPEPPSHTQRNDRGTMNQDEAQKTLEVLGPLLLGALHSRRPGTTPVTQRLCQRVLEVFTEAVDASDFSRPLRGVPEPESLVRSLLAQWRGAIQQEVGDSLSTSIQEYHSDSSSDSEAGEERQRPSETRQVAVAALPVSWDYNPSGANGRGRGRARGAMSSQELVTPGACYAGIPPRVLPEGAGRARGALAKIRGEVLRFGMPVGNVPRPRSGDTSGRCWNCGAYGHLRGDCKEPKSPDDRCFGCGRLGYRLSNCPKCAEWWWSSGGSFAGNTRDPKLTQIYGPFERTTDRALRE